MRADRRNRIAEGCAVLDPDPVDGVRVVAAPDLRRIVQHPRVKTASSSAAAFDEQIRVLRMQSLQKTVQTEDIIVEDASLIVSAPREDVRDAAVVVPLQIIDTLIHNPGRLLIDSVDHLRPRKIEYELIPSADCPSVRRGQRPVRMRAEQKTLLADHLRLEPDPELQPLRVHVADQVRKRAAELRLVDSPVP